MIAEEFGNEEGADDLDDYMMIVAKRLDRKTRISFKHRLALLRKVSGETIVAISHCQYDFLCLTKMMLLLTIVERCFLNLFI